MVVAPRGTGRLRRKIGLFIRTRPDGAFALAAIYGHASSIIGAATAA